MSKTVKINSQEHFEQLVRSSKVVLVDCMFSILVAYADTLNSLGRLVPAMQSNLSTF
jgi:hypothetical protein